LGAAFVALLLLSGDLGGQASAVTDSRSGQSPLMLSGLGYQLSATSETRAGEAPIVPGRETQPFVAEILTPLLGLELRRPYFDLQAFYGPRLYWEDPNPTSTGGAAPLILHTVGLALDTQPSHNLLLTGSATGSLGSPDYTALPQVLGTVQGALPRVLSLASVTALTRIRNILSRRWELELTAGLFHYQLRGVTDADIAAGSSPGQPFITSQTSLSAQPGATYLLDLRNSLGLSAAVDEVTYSDGVALLTVTPAVTWKSRLTRRDDLKLTVGYTYGRSLATPAGLQDPFGSTSSGGSPVGSVELISRIARQDGIAVQSRVAAGVDFYIDPILGTALPRGTASGALTLISIPRWMISLRGDFATALRDPRVGLAGPVVMGQPTMIPPDETAFSVSLAARRRVSENLFAEIGMLWADRGPVLSTPEFQFHQRQLWIHVAVTGTTKPISRQVQPQ
jgi:hypothetical protein